MRSLALIAAHQAADAVTGLLLHDDEGHFGDLDVVEKLAEAVSLTCELRIGEVETCDAEYLAALRELQAGAAKFIEAWAG